MHSRSTAPLATVALLVILAAMIAALAGSYPARTPDGGPTYARGRPDSPAPRAQKESSDPVVLLARRYALAARNWTPASYRASWQTQTRLAAGRYRRELSASRPTRRELAALRADRAWASAKVLGAERNPEVRPPNARVLVTLDETTVAAGQTVHGGTVNEVRLRSHGGRWRVVGWTVIPGHAPDQRP